MSTVMIGTDDEMGSMLSEFIRKRKAKGLSLKTKAAGGILSFEKAGKGGKAPAPGGPVAFVQQNPLLIAGIAGGAVLIFLMVKKRRKGRK